MSLSIRPVHRALLLAFAAMALACCSPATPPVNYYSLLDLSPAKPATAPVSSLVIAVGPVTVPDILQKSQIAVGDPEGPYQVSDFHRWAGEVDRDVARAVAEQLAARLDTEQVSLYAGEQTPPPSHQVQLDILEMSGKPGGQANLVVRWSLSEPKSSASPLTRRFACSIPTTEPGYGGWVTTQRQCLGRLSEEIAAAIRPKR